jgi:hypothetical protein
MLHELRGDHLYVESSTAGVFVSDDGEWYLRTRLNRSVGATCATHGSFRVPSGGTRTVFEERGAYATFFSPVSVAIASAHKFGFLTAVQGRFWGLGEAAWVSASSLGYQALWADVDNIYAVGALGRAYHAGLGDQNVLVKLYGYRDGYVRGTLASSGTFTYEVSTVSGYQSFWLPPRDLAICAIERFQGRYETEDDYLRYYENDSQWFGKIDSNHAANGAFRCMAYDQR